MKITTNGQVTIPHAIREKYRFLPGTDVLFVDHGDHVTIRKSGHKQAKGRHIIEHLRGQGGVTMTTDQIMRLTRR